MGQVTPFSKNNGEEDEKENQMITKIRELLLNPHVEEEWRLKRNLMLSEKTDLNEWMINYFHSLI